MAHVFAGRARNALSLGGGPSVDHLAIAEPFIAAYSMTSEIAISARMAAGEDAAATAVSERRTDTLIELGEASRAGVQIEAFLLREARASGDFESIQSRAKAVEAGLASVLSVQGASKAREQSALANLHLLETLKSRNLSGRAWLEAARAEESTAVLFLPAG